MKTCTKCGETKELDQFYKEAGNRDGLRKECKVCSSAKHRRYLLAKKDALGSAGETDYEAIAKEYRAVRTKAYQAAKRRDELWAAMKRIKGE